MLKIIKADYWSTAGQIKSAIPELKNVLQTDIEEHLRGTGLHFIRIKKADKPKWIRFTMPLAILCKVVYSYPILAIILLYVFSPIKYLITGRWRYSSPFLTNWLNSIGF